MQLVITVEEQTEEVLEVNPDADAEAVIGEPERVVHSLTGEADVCGGFLDAAAVEHGIAVGMGGVELEAVPDDADDESDVADDDVEEEEEDGGVVVEVPDVVVTSYPSCDPWMSQGCLR